MHKYLYICTSPLLNTFKIGYHNGTPFALFKRYQTALGEQVEFVMFSTPKPEEHEIQLHRILQPYRVNGEHFRKDEKDIFYVYCYMAKCLTGCTKAELYSRKKYGFARDKSKWQYDKMERDEETNLNTIISNIEKCGNISIDVDEDDLVKAMQGIVITAEDNIMDDIEEVEPMDTYVDNPFSRWAYKPRS